MNKDIGIIAHIGAGSATSIVALNSLKSCADELIRHTVKEVKQLHEIIEMDRVINITTSHHHITNKKRDKKPFWKNGKLRYK